MSEPIDRRKFLSHSLRLAAGTALLGGGASSLLAACGSSSSSSSGARAHSYDGVSTEVGRHGGQLTFGTEAEETGFDPHSDSWDESGILYARTVYDPLAIVAMDGTIQPYLAQSITPNQDYSVWSIQARPGVLFHDGVPFDAQALYANLTASKHALLTGITLGPMESVSIIDSMTVSVKMSQPWVPFDAYLAGGIGGQVAYMMSPAILGTGKATTHPIGTGPFVFDQWVPNSHFTATANPHYWRPGLPYLSQITYKPIPDAQARLASLESGAVDIIHTSTAQSILQLRSKLGYGYVDDSGKVVGETDMGYVMLNVGKSPFNDARVRQAIAYSTNYAQYLSVVDSNVNEGSIGPFDAGTPYYGPTEYPSYNLAKAKKLVSDYERTNGRISFELSTTDNPTNSSILSLLQGMWQRAGISSTINLVDQDTLISNAENGGFQANLWRQGAAVDPDLNYIFWSSTTVGKEGGLSINFARNADPVMQAALEKGRTDPDPQVRAEAYKLVARRFASDLPYIWLDRTVWAIGADPKVRNFNYATVPNGGRGFGMMEGIIWPTQLWIAL
ncbi:MAG: ABC transporter substrate-binding protein [Actinobacteria bacterium]|nr:ABC transporter substrate-binding protein [Actinomycetota bacterium]